MTTCTDTPIARRPARGRISSAVPRLATSTSTADRRRTFVARFHATALAIWRLLPAMSSSTPSDDAISSLSQSDRLGERR